MNVVITGANRGIGLELTRQYSSRGDHVIATVRRLESATALQALPNVRVAQCDVADELNIRAFAATVTEPVHVLINNAGVRTRSEPLAAPDAEDIMRTFRVNALGALLVTSALLPALYRAGHAKVASISSNLGSLEQNDTGGGYGYRMSKVALNMVMRSASRDLRRDGHIAVTLSPGWVQTDMGGAQAPTKVADSAAGIIAVIDRLQPADSGAFLDFQGVKLAW